MNAPFPEEAPSLWQQLAEDFRVNRAALERAVVCTYRLRHWGLTRAPRAAWRTVAVLLLPLEFALRLMMSGQISARARFGRRLRIAHAWGIVVHPSVVAGDDCHIYHQVTLGVNEHRADLTGPRLGNSVYIGAGAKIIGAVRLGDGATVGANAVVVRDVPPHHLAVGVPAVCRPRRDRTAPEAAQNQESG